MSYRIDVSTNFFFTEFVEGYEDLDVGLVNSFEVTGLDPMTDYYCRIRTFDGEESGPNSRLIHAKTDPVGLDESVEVVGSFICSPNPTQGIVNLHFTVYNLQSVSIRIYDMQGREVGTVVDRMMPAGEHVVQYDLSGLTEGVYVLELRAKGKGQRTVSKLVVQ